jgi:hypothetical protein
MHARTRILFALVTLLATSAGALSISIEDVRLDYGKGEYRSALDKTSKLLSTSLQEPSPSDKYELLMLRGECQLQLKDRLGAITSFKSAAKVADNVNQLAIAKADALIVEKSSLGKYAPRFSADKTPIDVVPLESRRQAMSALKADLWSENKSQIDAALQATTLPPIEKVFVPVSNMFFLETAATGQATDTDKLMRDLGQLTYRLMQTETTRLSRKIEQLSQAANSSSTGDGNWGGVRRGLFSEERDGLKTDAAYLVQLRDRATEYRGIAGKLGGNEQRWDGLVLDINDTLAAAEVLYNDR